MNIIEAQETTIKRDNDIVTSYISKKSEGDAIGTEVFREKLHLADECQIGSFLEGKNKIMFIFIDKNGYSMRQYSFSMVG